MDRYKEPASTNQSETHQAWPVPVFLFYFGENRIFDFGHLLVRDAMIVHTTRVKEFIILEFRKIPESVEDCNPSRGHNLEIQTPTEKNVLETRKRTPPAVAL